MDQPGGLDGFNRRDMWRQFILLFALGGGVALFSAFLTTALYTRRFRLISETLRQAEAGTYAARPQYAEP